MLPQKIIHYLNSKVKLQFEGMQIRIARFTRLEDDGAWNIPSHAHKNYELHYIDEGEGQITLGNSTFTVSAGQFYVCPPFIDHSQATTPGRAMKEYCIECDFICPTDGSAEGASSLLQTVARSLYYCHGDENGFLANNFSLLDKMLRGAEGQPPAGTDALVKSVFLSTVLGMLCFLRMESSAQDQNRDWNDINYKRASSILNYLEANYKKDVSIAECAKIFFLSEKQINRILQKVFDSTFHELKVQTRVNVAVRLIQTTEDPLEVIAGMAGFSGYRQMIRCFKSMGLDRPTSYRKSQTGHFPPQKETN